MTHRHSIVPHNVRVEEALLGCAVLGAYNDLCVQGVTRNWFNELLHQATWDMMEAQVGKDPVSLESLSIAAKTDKGFKECGGTALTLVGMADEAPFAGNWNHLAAGVAEVPAASPIPAVRSGRRSPCR